MKSYLYKDLYIQEKVHFWHVSKRKTALALINQFLIVDKPKILDVGCGTGENVSFFSQLGEVWGIDNSQEALDFCKKRGLNNVKLASSDNTGYKENGFDAVTMFDLLEHVDEAPTLKEAARILKDDGLLVLTLPSYPWLWSKWDEELHHKRRYTAEKLSNVLTLNGFKVVKSSYMYSFLLPIVFIVRLIKALFFRKRAYPSDFSLSSPFINYVFSKICTLERWFVIRIGVPFGTSLICVARKV